VTIYYDSALVPHIYAANDEDLYAAQDYITAKNRLWQMDFQTHAAGGRISEIVGKTIVKKKGIKRFVNSISTWAINYSFKIKVLKFSREITLNFAL